VRKNVIILGAAGRDFHNFNSYYRGNKEYNVVAFTATQIPNIEGRKYTVGRLSETFKIYPEIGTLLPAMGYDQQQLKDLETTINNTVCDAVIIGTPIDLNRIIDIKRPSTRVYYDLVVIGSPNLEEILSDFVKRQNLY
jgi:predicted GTPase